MREWHGIDEEDQIAWTEIRDRVYRSAEPVICAGSCPSCGQAEVRYFYWRSDEPGDFGDRGGSWFWCPACLRYGHYSALVPAWWSDLDGVDYDELEHRPEWLEEHWREVLAAGHPMKEGQSEA